MDATILVNRTHRLPRKAIPQTLVEPEIIFDAPVGDRKRLLAASAAKGVEALFARGKEEGIYLCGVSGYRSYERQEELYQKKLREQQESDRLAAMSDDDVMQASMNRVSQDTERLTRRNMKLCVMEDVQTECLADPAFARLVMNPKKKMLNCFHYINRKAREYLEQEMK